MITLFTKENHEKHIIKSIHLQKNGLTINDFFISYNIDSSNKQHYYWRLTNKNGSQHISLRLEDGLINNIEHSFDLDGITHYESCYTMPSNVVRYIPFLYLLPNDNSINSESTGIYINSYINFNIFSYIDAFKISWSEKVAKIVLLSNIFAYELSETNELLGIVILKSLEDTFEKDMLDLTLYP